MVERVIILDRDGVVNHDSDDYIKSPDEWQAVPGSLEAIAKLSNNGYRVFIISNQSGVARGLFNIETLNNIHKKLHKELTSVGGKVEAILFCPHAPDDNCECRKPKPGLLHELSKRANISLKGVPFVGDTLRDLQAAIEVDAKPILVKTGKGERTIDNHIDELPEDTAIYEDLAAVVAGMNL